jgi:hypothetical protein
VQRRFRRRIRLVLAQHWRKARPPAGVGNPLCSTHGGSCRARSLRPGKQVASSGGSAPKLDHGCDSVTGPGLRCRLCLAGVDGIFPPPVAPPPEGIVAGGHGRPRLRLRLRPRRRPGRQPCPQALAPGPPHHGRCPGGTAQGHQEASRVARSHHTPSTSLLSDGGVRRRDPCCPGACCLRFAGAPCFTACPASGLRATFRRRGREGKRQPPEGSGLRWFPLRGCWSG